MNTTFAGARLQGLHGLRRCWGCARWGHPGPISWDATGAPSSPLLWPEGSWQYYCERCSLSELDERAVCEFVGVPRLFVRAHCRRQGISFEGPPDRRRRLSRHGVAVAALLEAIGLGVWPAWAMATLEPPRLTPGASVTQGGRA